MNAQHCFGFVLAMWEIDQALLGCCYGTHDPDMYKSKPRPWPLKATMRMRFLSISSHGSLGKKPGTSRLVCNLPGHSVAE